VLRATPDAELESQVFEAMSRNGDLLLADHVGGEWETVSVFSDGATTDGVLQLIGVELDQQSLLSRTTLVFCSRGAVDAVTGLASPMVLVDDVTLDRTAYLGQSPDGTRYGYQDLNSGRVEPQCAK